MTRFIYILIATFLFTGCNNEREVITYKNSVSGEVVTDTLPFGDLRDFPEIAKADNIDSLINGMISDECVYERAVGIGGSYTRNYACFERLCEIQDEIDWFRLIKHQNPNVRLYAYKALEARNSEYLRNARRILSNDTAKVCTLSGCFIMTSQLSQVIKAQ